MRRFFTVALALALGSSACGRSTAVTGTELRPVSVEVPGYDGSVAINPASRRLNAKWSIRFVADSATTDSVEWLLNEGLNVSRVSGQNVAGYVARPLDDRRGVTVRLKSQLALGSVGQIDLEYAGVPVFGSDSINGIAPTWVELGLDSHWFPVFAGYGKRIVAHVQVGLPPGWMMVASGNVVRDGKFLVLETRIPQTDIAFAA